MAEMMLDRDILKQMLLLHEGMRLKPYRCSAGKLTIGVGRNLDEVGITRQEAMVLLDHDINRVEQQMASLSVWHKLDAIRRLVLADMCFNLGYHRLMQFKRMFAALREDNYEGAAAEMLDSKWAQQVGARAQRLAKMMATGRLDLSELERSGQ